MNLNTSVLYVCIYVCMHVCMYVNNDSTYVIRQREKRIDFGSRGRLDLGHHSHLPVRTGITSFPSVAPFMRMIGINARVTGNATGTMSAKLAYATESDT
jgi:hypothetical protein